LTLPFRIGEEANAEMAEAARWYEVHRAGWGTEFLDAVDTAVERIAAEPRVIIRFKGASGVHMVDDVFELPADLLPDDEQGTLVVRMHRMITPRDNHVIATLCGVLNDLAICYPGTGLRLVLEATQPPPASR